MTFKNIFRPPLLLLGFTIPTLFGAPQTFAAPLLCREALAPSVGLTRGLMPEYVSRYFTNNKNRVIEVPNQAPIMDQGVRGFCFMYSWFEQMTHTYRTQHKGASPGVSLYYIAYHHWLRRATEVSLDPTAPIEIPEGGSFEYVTDLIRDVGFMTEVDWKNLGGKTDIEVRSKNIIELGQLKFLVTNAHLEKRIVQNILKPEIDPKKSKGGFFTNILTNPSLNDQIKKFALKKELQLKAGKTKLTSNQVKLFSDFYKGQLRDLDLKASEIQSILYNLDRDIENEVKEQFNYMFFGTATNPLDGKDLNANRNLMRSIYPEIGLPTITLASDGSRKGRIQYLGRENDHLLFLAPFDKILSAIRSEIDSGRSVYIGYDHESYYDDDKVGALTIQGMISKPKQAYMSRAMRLITQTKPAGHGTQIVGYEIDDAGNILALKMQNSWGMAAGMSGYYRMDLSFFQAFVLRISFFDMDRYFTPKVIQKLDGQTRPK